MTRAFPFPVVLHFNPPTVPEFHDFIRPIEPGTDHPGAQIRGHGAHLRDHALPGESFEIVTVNLGKIAPEMVIADPAGAAVFRCTLFRNDRRRPAVTRPDGRHQARNAAPDAQHICHNFFAFTFVPPQ